MRRLFPIVVLCAAAVLAQTYSGPRPQKADLPYLVHADDLIATESTQAKQEDRKGETIYTIEGASSAARTPLASPSFLMQQEEVEANKLQLYKLESKGGQREILFAKKKKQLARPIRLHVTKVEDNLYRIEVDEILDNGEYSLTPEGSNQVFCFEVY
jgi:hypothetical protein